MKPCPFIGLLILNVINRFMFGNELHIYYLLHMQPMKDHGKPSLFTCMNERSMLIAMHENDKAATYELCHEKTCLWGF